MRKLPSAMSDAELCERVADGCARGFVEFDRRCRGLRFGVASEFFFVGQARDDVLQRAEILAGTVTPIRDVVGVVGHAIRLTGDVVSYEDRERCVTASVPLH